MRDPVRCGAVLDIVAMRTIAVTLALLFSACSGETVLTPSPAPEAPTAPTTTIEASLPVTEAPPAVAETVTEAVEEVEEAVTTTTAPPPLTIPRRTTTTTIYEPPSPQSHTPPAYIAECESGGNPRAVNPNGHYGKWQFSQRTWESVGGTGRPDHASESEQDYRASVLWNNGHGASHWSCA